MLDTVHFNGMNTSLEAFAVGTPVVTLPAALQRGRHTQAMYRRMGLDDLIAADADGYVEQAVRLANDASYRRAVSDRILAANGATVYINDHLVQTLGAVAAGQTGVVATFQIPTTFTASSAVPPL